ncbi:1-(5-phosphoribosyl)-5-[(5-phosphoribosylamino)methylideneamino]imidazole-4-carboxamide isomerase [Maricaulis sp. D1M11]|uniref:1-(5-phosphoribosyl)-5-[(5- phosphoribosylamino)methylideneamino]imidazole-4- carboxamide isomerase n=1 Tax=Maricaulis sp. D1M11 TaxID=3076117 RepID=UPI0039B673E6
MILYPAIDLLDGRVVRLRQGAFNAVTEYDQTPPEAARAFGEAGTSWLHVVDLAGARDGARRQTELIAEICKTGLRVQTGGGVRSSEDIENLLAVGVERVVIGSLAVSQPSQVSDWIRQYGPEHIALALDVRKLGETYRPALQGWTDTHFSTLQETIDAYESVSLRHALVTDIGRDGALAGPNLALYSSLLRDYPGVDWQASGGVSSLGDLRALRDMGVAGAITGKALYEGKFTLEEALACSQGV